jgi:hypothetical protein
MKKIVKSEKELVGWFKKNFKSLGYDEILKENKNTFPDFIMSRNGRKIRVEIELRTSHFILHKHSPKKVDEVVCIDDDTNLDKKTIVVDGLEYEPKKAKRVSIVLDDEQLKILNSLKGLGMKEAEKVKNILIVYLSEKGYFNKK